MKSFSPILFALWGLLSLASCGKESSDDKSSKSTQDHKTQEEIKYELSSDLKRSIERNDLDLFKILLHKHPKLNLNQTTNEGETLLTAVIKRGYDDFRDYLILKGANAKKPNTNGETPMVAAVLTRSYTSVLKLLDKNVDLNQKDDSGRTALHQAIIQIDDNNLTHIEQMEAEKIAVLLVKAGASVEATGPDDKNAFKLAVDHNSKTVQDLIRKIFITEYKVPDETTFATVIKTGSFRSLNFILTRNPNAAQKFESINPLVLAIKHQSETTAIKMIQLLVNYKAKVNGPENAETTPLIESVKTGNSGFVVLFIDMKADLQIKDVDGKSALYHAIANRNPELVGILVRAGASENYSTIRFSFNACSMVKGLEALTTGAVELKKIADIRSNLTCRRSWWSL